jgi:non-heme chloroperoxidase
MTLQHRSGGHAAPSRAPQVASTGIVEIKGRGQALTIDSGWREVVGVALAFVRRCT